MYCNCSTLTVVHNCTLYGLSKRCCHTPVNVAVCHSLWWICTVVFLFLCLLYFQRCTERLGRVSPPQSFWHTQTPAADRQSAPAEKPWSSLYLLPDDFISTVWYMAPASPHLFQSFLLIVSLYLTESSTLVFCSFAFSDPPRFHLPASPFPLPSPCLVACFWVQLNVTGKSLWLTAVGRYNQLSHCFITSKCMYI